MSLFSKIGKIFGEQKEKELSVEDAIKIVHEQKAEKIHSIIENSHKNAQQIYSEIQNLRSMLADFTKVRVEEKRAKASNDVKDRFCITAEKQLSLLEKPEKNLENIRSFIEKTEKTFALLGGLTPKQMMHIGFFFKGEISAIARKVTIINDLVENTKKDMHTIKDYDKFFIELNELKSIENDLLQKESDRKLLENTIKEFESQLASAENAVNKFDFSSLNEAARAFAQAELEKSSIEQELLSLLSVNKMLKKMRYEKDMKDSTLDAYINSPTLAIIADSDMKIFTFIEKVEPKDPKEREKQKRIIDNKDYISKKREELLVSIENMGTRRSYMMAVKERLSQERSVLVKQKNDIETQLNSHRKDVDSIINNISEINRKINKLKTETNFMALNLAGS